MANEMDNQVKVSKSIQDELTITYESAFKRMDKEYRYSPNNIHGNTITKMLRDGTIASCLRSMKLSVQSKGFTIQSAVQDKNAPDYEMNKDLADFISFAITDGRDDNINKALFCIMSAIENEISVTELNYKIQHNGQYKGKIVWRDWKTREQEVRNCDFTIMEDSHGNLKGIEQRGQELDIHKVLIFNYLGGNSTTYSHDSIFSALYRDWYCKQVLINLKNIYLELLSKINLYIKHDKNNLTDQERDDVKTLLNNFSRGGQGYFPTDYEINVLDLTAGGKGDEFQNAIDYFDNQMRLKLGKPKLLDEGGNTGSYALSNTQANDYYLNLQYIQSLLGDVVNEAIVRLIDYNFVTDTYPKFIFNDIVEEDNESKIKKIELALNTGIMSKSENESIRQYLGLPMQDSENETNEEVDSAVETDTTNASKPVANEIDSSTDETSDISSDTSTQVLKDEADKKIKLAEVEWRKPKFLDDSDLRKIENASMMFVDEATEYAMTVVEKQLDWVKDYKRVKRILNTFNTDAVRKLAIPYRSELEGKIYRPLKEFYKLNKKQIAVEINQQSGRKLVDFLITDTATKDVENILRLIGFNTSQIISDDILTVYQQNIVTGLENGLSEVEVVANTLNELENKGISLESSFNVRTRIRTASTMAMNNARKQVATESKVYGYEYSAIMDSRTTRQCELLDGGLYKADDKYLGKITPPNHYNCRSILNPVVFQEDFTEAKQEFEQQEFDVSGKSKDLFENQQKALDVTTEKFGGRKPSNQRINNE